VVPTSRISAGIAGIFHRPHFEVLANCGENLDRRQLLSRNRNLGHRRKSVLGQKTTTSFHFSEGPCRRQLHLRRRFPASCKADAISVVYPKNGDFFCMETAVHKRGSERASYLVVCIIRNFDNRSVLIFQMPFQYRGAPPFDREVLSAR
jgi:hypothetical protein